MNTCVFSPCRTYRYRLEHVFDPSKPLVAFVMLNPSTADEQQLDPTLRRCRGFANAWGYGGFIVSNLFAFRATDPRVMKAAADPVGPENDHHLERIAIESAAVICAWGQHGKHQGRAERVSWALRRHQQLHAIELSKDGAPKHPLYLPGHLTPIRFASERTTAA
jgi:hypothetical protein